MLPSRQAKRTPACEAGPFFLPGDGDTRQLPALAAGLCSYLQLAGHLHASQSDKAPVSPPPFHCHSFSGCMRCYSPVQIPAAFNVIRLAQLEKCPFPLPSTSPIAQYCSCQAGCRKQRLRSERRCLMRKAALQWYSCLLPNSTFC